MEIQEPTVTVAPTRNTNWWGLSSAVGFFVLVLFWGKRQPESLIETILGLTALVAIHACAIKAAPRRYGWVYLVPIGVYWILVIIGLSGGITY
jgi:hypothetical protein